jgi:NAD(P)-dependent dehydrogenase (short-subunit alcohol dehydrogenase family)
MFESKVALVTGGGSGIGQATALAFAREKATVAVADVAVQNGEETAHMINETGGEAIFINCDVTKAVDVQSMVKKTVQAFGRLDYAFNNAGIEGVLAPIVEYPEEIWNRVISINLTGVWLCMKYEVPEILKQGGGAIVNTSSAAGLVGVGSATAYTAGKHGVVGLTKSVALEYARAGIRVNAVCPGAIRTPMLERLVEKHPKMEEWYLSVPAGRIAAVDELAEAVVWLCSDKASFVTGHAMAVDGGLTAC